MPSQFKWNLKKIELVKETLRKFLTVKESLPTLSKKLEFTCTEDMLTSAFRRTGENSLSHFLKKNELEPGDDLKRLFQLSRKSSTKFSDLCDKMDMSPSKVKNLIEEAWAFGIPIKITQDHIGIDIKGPNDNIINLQISPTVGQRQMLGHISDTHLGSHYCLREQLKDFIHYAYEKGVREITHSGDILDGDYGHGKFEMSHMGIDRQTEDLFETLPQLKGLTYHAITGNHDNTFTEKSGVDVGQYIVNHFKRRGRNDFYAYGNRGAFLKIRGAVIALWHPRSGGAYATSYGIQKKIESYSSGYKPQILLIGHWHRFAYCDERGVQGIASPTFQGAGSAFSKSLVGTPAIGGLILSWDITKNNTLRSFIIEKRAYFEKEDPIRVEAVESGIAVVRK